MIINSIIKYIYILLNSSSKINGIICFAKYREILKISAVVMSPSRGEFHHRVKIAKFHLFLLNSFFPREFDFSAMAFVFV